MEHPLHHLWFILHLRLKRTEYGKAKKLLTVNSIQVEKEIAWENDIKSKSIYFKILLATLSNSLLEIIGM